MAKKPASQMKHGRVRSEAVRQSLETRSSYKPVLVSGISDGKLITVSPGVMFKRLDVDSSYQRGETRMVTQIIRALQAGGKVLDPVTLCQRRGGETWWIVDGHQRVCAFQALNHSFTAMLHQSDSAEAEKDFFIALNAKRNVSANIIVKAWNGPSGAMIRKANESMEHPLYGRINLQQSSSDSKMAASSVARGIMVLIATDNSLPVASMMSRIDLALASPKAKAQAEHYLRLIGRLSPKGYLPVLVLRAIATVARERWAKSIDMPSLKVQERLRCKHWAAEVQLVEKMMPILLDVVRKVWKAA